ncbi:hypothetical protein TNCV_622511 [Trichonephila clavipes]|nr:hypothetical protein TNCV_622511 [Trichonephila clavipes]
MKPRCLKCDKEHTTKECEINTRLENPYCINCLQYGHSARYTKCPKFPKPRKEAPTVVRKLITSYTVVSKDPLQDDLLRVLRQTLQQFFIIKNVRRGRGEFEFNARMAAFESRRQQP